MEKFVAGLIGALDRGLLSRRQFCETLALGATVYAAGAGAANAAPARGFKIIGINHISYACSDYRKARAFYSAVLGMQNLPAGDNGHETRLMFGPAAGKGGSFMIPRNGNTAGHAKSVVDHAGNALSTDLALRVTGIDHISYTCTDLKRSADWYSKLFNLEQSEASDSKTKLPFGPKGEPYLVMRAQQARATGEDGQPRRKAKALVNHIAYTIADFDKERVRAELKRLGYPNPLQDGEHSFHIVDPDGFDVQISGIEMTALGG
jgi:catechol 2,3-dioxygenase-like lactoylglutathione lyase family enzyme